MPSDITTASADTSTESVSTPETLFSEPVVETTDTQPSQETQNAPATTPSATTPAKGQVAATPSQPEKQFPPAQQALTPEQIANIAAETASRFNQQQAPAATKPAPAALSDEEFNKAFNVVTVDDKTFQSIMGYTPDSPEQVKNLQNFSQAIVKQTMTMAEFRMNQKLQELEGRFTGQLTPIVKERETQIAQKTEEEFYTTHPELKGHEALVREIASNLHAQGHKFTDKTQAFKQVAEKVKSLLPANLLSSGTNQQQSPQNSNQPVASKRTMATTSVGGQTSANTGTNRPVTDARSLFG